MLLAVMFAADTVEAVIVPPEIFVAAILVAVTVSADTVEAVTTPPDILVATILVAVTVIADTVEAVTTPPETFVAKTVAAEMVFVTCRALAVMVSAVAIPAEVICPVDNVGMARLTVPVTV